MPANPTPNPSILDFSIIKTRLDTIKQENSLHDYSSAFYFFALDLILNLQDDEITDSITDTNYIMKETSSPSGHDRGIDAIYIDEDKEVPIVHLFNCKCAESLDKARSNISASEIDKIHGFLNSLMSKDTQILNETNPVLSSKIQEIWTLCERISPKFVFHLCSNYYLGFEPAEEQRFRRGVERHRYVDIKYYLMPDLLELLTKRGKKIVNARLRGVDKRLFEKSSGDIGALILDVPARDLIRILIDDEDARMNPDLSDYGDLRQIPILEDAFQDNVRVYMKQRTKINKSIKKTALSEERHRFFYYNNGITITCDSFEYPPTMKSPIIDLKNIQIVNGGQTVYSLYEAFNEDPTKFEHIDILCRIYNTRNSELGLKIAEYTNSQNPVKSRDIRSIDQLQIKLELELLGKGYFYERKKNQFSSRPKNLRLDAEKVGQVLMTWFNKMPAEAKNKKSVIFGDMYETIFHDKITANEVLLAYELFKKVEEEKGVARDVLVANPDTYDKKSYLLHASYYVMYVLRELSDYLGIGPNLQNLNVIFSLYPVSLQITEHLVEVEKKSIGADKYSHGAFFKSDKPKVLLCGLFEGKTFCEALKQISSEESAVSP